MKSKKALITTTTPYMIKQFLMNDILLLQELGYKVEIATNFNSFNVISNEALANFRKDLDTKGIKIKQISFTRKISDVKSIYQSFKETKKLLNNEKYDLIHTHTPISGLVTRIAFRRSQIYCSCRMIYTAHGFHFFKGNNPIKNIIFKTIEKYTARYTDVLITINREDFEAAKQFKLKLNGGVEYIPGVGIDIDKIDSIQGNKKELCKEMSIPNDSILLLSVGELNENKNHKIVIQALSDLPDNIHYIICGTGSLKEQHKQLAKELQVEDRLHLLGYKENIIEIMKSCDIFVFPSKREGLSVALMEAMACGLPCIASNIRGNNDLIKNRVNERTGFLFENSFDNCKEAIIKYLDQNQEEKYEISIHCKKQAQKYGLVEVQKKINYIYRKGDR